MRIGHTSEVYILLSNKLLCKIYIRDTLNYLNSRCNTVKLLWVVIYVVCYGWFSPDLVVINICRQRLIKVDRPLWQRSLANENAVVCRQGAMRWRLFARVIQTGHLLHKNEDYLYHETGRQQAKLIGDEQLSRRVKQTVRWTDL